jgi:hypothetical protein
MIASFFQSKNRNIHRNTACVYVSTGPNTIIEIDYSIIAADKFMRLKGLATCSGTLHLMHLKSSRIAFYYYSTTIQRQHCYGRK